MPVPPTTMAPATPPRSSASTSPLDDSDAAHAGARAAWEAGAPRPRGAGRTLSGCRAPGSLLPATPNGDQAHDAAQNAGSAAHVDRVPKDRGRDGNIIGLLQFPDVLRWLDANPGWTDEMGQAVTYQQGDVSRPSRTTGAPPRTSAI